MHFQRFNLSKTHPHFEDFCPKFNHRDSLETKLAAFATAFRHLQIDKYIKEHPAANLRYETFKNDLNLGVPTTHTEAFYRDYLTMDLFETYLESEGDPIRMEALATEAHAKIYRIPFDRERGFSAVKLDQIPKDQREVGRVIALQDLWFNRWYQVRVHAVEPERDRISLDHRGIVVPREKWEPILENMAII